MRGSQALDKANALRSMLAFSLTLVVGYGALALLLLVWPAIATGFMKALFDALDLFHMQAGPDFLSFPYLLYVLLGTLAFVAALAFVYSWIRSWLGRRHG